MGGIYTNLDRIIAVSNHQTVYRDSDRCLKVFNTEPTGERALFEAYAQALAAKAGLPVPPVLKVCQINQKWAIVSSYLKGKTLSRLLAEQPQNAGALLQQLAAAANLIWANRSPALPGLLGQLLQGLWRSGLPAGRVAELKTQLLALPQKQTLCHGNLTPENIMITPGGELYILNWALAAAGCPEVDAAVTYLWLLKGGNSALANNYLSLLCSQSSLQPQQITGLLPAVAAAKLYRSTPSTHAFLTELLNSTKGELQ